MTVGVCEKHPEVTMDYRLIREGICPTCRVPMDVIDDAMTTEDGLVLRDGELKEAYGKCPCCGWAWRADSESIYVVLEPRGMTGR